MEYRLTCAAMDREGMNALARMDRDLTELDPDEVEISFADFVRCDTIFKAPLRVVLDRFLERGKFMEREKRLGMSCPLAFYAGDAIEFHPTRIPVANFKTSEIDRFYDYLDQHLEGKGLPPLNSAFCLQLLQCLGEVFVNTETHSDSALGVFFCGQHDPIEQCISLAIADAGITIPESIARRFGNQLSPVQALKWAMKKGNTTKKNTPGGIGLKLLRDFALEQHGSVWIASGKAFWEIQDGVEMFFELDDPFPGTVVNLKIPTEPTPGALPPELSELFQKYFRIRNI